MRFRCSQNIAPPPGDGCDSLCLQTSSDSGLRSRSRPWRHRSRPRLRSGGWLQVACQSLGPFHDGGYVARFAFKLLQIQVCAPDLDCGATVLDHGCAPGGWLQVACQSLGPFHGRGYVARFAFKSNVVAALDQQSSSSRRRLETLIKRIWPSGSFGSEEHASIVYVALAVDKELQPDKVKRGMTVSSAGFHVVAFSYGNTNASMETKDYDVESSFRPNFPVTESLLHNLPPNEKIYQIISRTAMFVCKHGSQSEILLRVKQGDNPNAYRISSVRVLKSEKIRKKHAIASVI
ncbi:hypothetical protein VIGAN_01223900 [Vigna angularis var. angularis]|uniref:Uncharacterized protein n=1 Tax=Vigna angularis var. angularis TaxID=157739 RepID=A0A0S3R1P7_PHAAN|nr:hypothetical protein VIGAN_01223900 [Vigna angularis var. angularis]